MHYIAYGSNINLEQMEYRCPNSHVIGNGMLKGWKLVFNIHADIIYTGNIEDKVPVLIWEIANEDWKSLDRYEGFPSYYEKEIIKTYVRGNKTEECIAYVMADDMKGFSLPYEEYYNTIYIGYMENNLNPKYLNEALNYTFDMEKNEFEKS